MKSLVLFVLFLTCYSGINATFIWGEERRELFDIGRVVRRTNSELQDHQNLEIKKWDNLLADLRNMNSQLAQLNQLKESVSSLEIKATATQNMCQTKHESEINIQSYLLSIMNELQKISLSQSYPPKTMEPTIVTKKDFYEMEAKIMNRMEEWKKSFFKELEQQKFEVKDVSNGVKNIQHQISILPKMSDAEHYRDLTLEKLKEIKYSLTISNNPAALFENLQRTFEVLRFDYLERPNQCSEAFANITSKMERRIIDQVGVQKTTFIDALNKLQNNTDSCVNGLFSALSSMKKSDPNTSSETNILKLLNNLTENVKTQMDLTEQLLNRYDEKEPIITKKDFENIEVKLTRKMEDVVYLIRDENNIIKLLNKWTENADNVKKQMDLTEQLLHRYDKTEPTMAKKDFENMEAKLTNKMEELVLLSRDQNNRLKLLNKLTENRDQIPDVV